MNKPRRWWIAAAVALIGAAAVLVIVQSFFMGSVRWQDAYRAMGVNEGTRDERLRLAQAMVDGEAPADMPTEQRLHAPGTLARLRYEQVDADGVPQNTYEIRALVPPLPYFGRSAPKSEFGEIECPQQCRDDLEHNRAALIDGSGKAGLADEWVLRMPAGRTFDLGQRSMDIQDLAQERPRALASSRMRVTLLQTCQTRARIGAVTRLEVYPNAIIPIPRGFHTSHWVQLDGCEEMMSAPASEIVLNPPVEPKPARTRHAWAIPEMEAVRPTRSSGIGYVSLNVDEVWLQQYGRAVAFHLVRACRYNAATNRWLTLPLPDGDGDISLRDKGAEGRVWAGRVAFRFPEDMALFWAEWEEIDQGSAGPGRRHRALLPAGGVDCRETDLPAPAAGEMVACVPSGMASETKLVPIPEENCAAPAAASIAPPPSR